MTTGRQRDVVIEEMQNGIAVELSDRSTRLHHRDEKNGCSSSKANRNYNRQKWKNALR